MSDFKKEDFEAIQSLVSASTHISAALNRIRALEKGLEDARSVINNLKDAISPNSYRVSYNSTQEKWVDYATKSALNITTTLGR